MATSSLAKDFVVEDRKIFKQFMKDIEVEPGNNMVTKTSLILEKGTRKLKQFSFDQIVGGDLDGHNRITKSDI